MPVKRAARSLPDDAGAQVLAILTKAREPMRMADLEEAAGLNRYRLNVALAALGKQVTFTGKTMGRRVGLSGKSPAKEVP